MRDYEELVMALRDEDNCNVLDYIEDAADAIEELVGRAKVLEKVADKWCDAVLEWISVEEPPNNDRNIFICHGSADFKAPCIGHYDPGMKLFYEDNNWFASPVYDAMFWCEMPKLPLPEPPKEEKECI